ncbi:MAG: FtsQ-type POTRA domain-containing protein [Longimicrobiales bacterium]|nr:FtsQ-type POTRA domain-containing protein [Longimicrobiales bacterium]
MRRDLRIILTTVLLAGLWTGGTRVAEAVSSLGTFRVTQVEITGLETVERGEILSLMELTGETSVWGDLQEWEERLSSHPLLEEVRVRRRIPGTLMVDLAERRPVALAPTPTLEPVDAHGRLLPLDPAQRRMDLPLLATSVLPAPGARLLPTRDRVLAAEVARLMEADTSFLRIVSEVSWGLDRNTVVAHWGEPSVDFLLQPGAPASRLREGLAVLADALARDPGQAPAVIDLRYADQVLVRRNH